MLSFSKSIPILLQVLLLLKSPVEGNRAVNKAEQQLMAKLFPSSSTSMKDVLPVKSYSSPVNVTIDIAVRQIMDITEKSQIISLSVWVRQYWNNPMLTWNKSQYDNISSINVDRNLVWVPDMCLYNTADDSGSLYQQLDTKIIVKNNGNCNWLAPIILRSECKIDVKYFPFDEQSCTLKFGSWTYNGKRIDVEAVNPTADLANYIENGEWEMVGIPSKKKVEFFPCCTEPYPSITYTVRIRRRILYYVSNLIVPCGVIAALAFLSFWLPAESGERISLVITVLLAMTVYMLMVSNAMPPTSEVIPLIGKFYLAVMVEIALCLVATCVTIKWHHTTTPMSPRLRYIIIHFFWRYFGGKIDKSTNKSPQVTSDKEFYHVNNNSQHDQSHPNDYERMLPSTVTQTQLHEITNHHQMTDIESIHKDISVLSTKVEGDQNEEDIRSDWKKAGKVLDRLFFIVFAVTFVLFSTILFAAVPGYKD